MSLLQRHKNYFISIYSSVYIFPRLSDFPLILRFIFLDFFSVPDPFFLSGLYIFFAKGRMAPSGFPGFFLHKSFTKSVQSLIIYLENKIFKGNLRFPFEPSL
jgi:hypothetical protein